MIQAEIRATNASSRMSEDGIARLAAKLAVLGDGWAYPVALVAGVFIVLEISGLLALSAGPREPFGGDWMKLIYAGRFSESLSIWQRWDALWYQHIAETGYNLESIAFFPLYPLVVSVVSLFVVGNTVLAGLIVSGVATVIGGYVTIRLLGLEIERDPTATGGRDVDARALAAAPPLAVALIVLFPTGFFLIAPFTESLFLALCLGAFWFARRGHPWVAGGLGLLASLTRIPGVFLAPALIFENMRQRGTFDWLRGRGGPRPGLDFLAGSLPALGAGGLVLFQSYVMGAAAVGLDARAAWGYHTIPPWQAIYESFQFIADGRGGPGQTQVEALNLGALLLFTVIAVVGVRRLPFSYWLYAWPSLGVLLTRGMFLSPQMSTARLVLVIFPCFFVVALWLARRPRLGAAWLVLSFAAELALFQYFVRWGFVG